MKEIYQNANIADPLENSEDLPDLVIINGCAVTQKAAAKSRQLISRMMREYPNSKIIVAGCIGEYDREFFERTAGVDYVLGVSDRFNAAWWNDIPSTNKAEIEMKITTPKLERARPFLKIQDGCDFGCSYCIIPKLRGKPVSMPQNSIIEKARKLIAQGAQEIVLTGVRIGAYGLDFNNNFSLLHLIELLLKIDDNVRYRLGSIEPWELTKELVDLAAMHPNVCSHLHIPLQHTQSKILRLMNRPEIGKTADLMFYAKGINPDLGLGTDIIAGFPGEKTTDFNRLIENLKKLPLTYLHPFSFSARTGTRAEHFSDIVDTTDVKERVNILKTIGINKKREFAHLQTGNILRAIPDKPKDNRKFVKAVTENYLHLKIRNTNLEYGKIVKVMVKTDKDGDVTGEIV